jgi:DHA1 family tetracycline resistance protein-like MFS transporter
MKVSPMKMPSWRHYTQFWYYGYAFQGVVVFGTGAILMPIIVNGAGDAAKAGTVMAFFYIGQLLAPLMGAITDRTGRHRLFYLSGYVLLAIGLALFPFTKLLWFWMALAFLQGVGSGTSNTVAAMLIVEYNPKTEWDARVGWLQTFYGVGQAAGLGLAAVLQARPEMGLLLSACLMAPAVLLGSRGLPPSHAHHKPKKAEFSRRSHRPPRTIHSILNRYEGTTLNSLRRLLKEWHSRFGIYIVGWFFVMLATWLIGALFPLLMKGAFNISYGMSSLYYAVGAVIGIFVYTPSGTLGRKIGDGWVVIIGTIMTLASVAGLAALAHVHSGLNQWLVPIVYILIPIAWSPLIVGGTAWAAQLATFAEGEALGSYNATTAVAAVIAAFTAGLVARQFGYGMVLIIGAVASLLALSCFVPLLSSVKRG